MGAEGDAGELVLSARVLGGLGGEVRGEHGEEPAGIWRRAVAVHHALRGVQAVPEERRGLPGGCVFQADGEGVHVRGQPDSGGAGVPAQEAGIESGGAGEGGDVASAEAAREEHGEIGSGRGGCEQLMWWSRRCM